MMDHLAAFRVRYRRRGAPSPRRFELRHPAVRGGLQTSRSLVAMQVSARLSVAGRPRTDRNLQDFLTRDAQLEEWTTSGRATAITARCSATRTGGPCGQA